MNCDQVFEVLTRGPFPTNSPLDVDVERHLAVCHECRGMAEALRPAVALFHESLSADESEGLPGYRGRLSPAAGVEGMVTAVLSEPLPGRERVDLAAAPPSAAKSSLWLVIASVALSAFAIGLWSAASVHNPGSGDMTNGRHDQVPELLRLASLNLPLACQATAVNNVEVQVAEAKFSLAHLRCCRDCHVVPNESRPPLDALAVVANSCSACH